MPGQKAEDKIRVEFNQKLYNPQDLIVYEKNNKDHPEEQIKELIKSIKKYGVVVPIIIDSNKVIIAGHGTREACLRLWLTEVPCDVRDDLTPNQARELRILHNRISELGKRNKDNLLFELRDLNDLDLAGLYPDLDPFVDQDKDKEEIEDEAPDIGKKYVVQKGDIFQLGDHFLMCGDSSDKEMVDKLMAWQKADMVFTDPPYNVAYVGKGKNTSNGIKNDDMSDVEFEGMLREWFARYRENIKTGGGYVCIPLNLNSGTLWEAYNGGLIFGKVSTRMEQANGCDGVVRLSMEAWAFLLLLSERFYYPILWRQNSHDNRRLYEIRRPDPRSYKKSERSRKRVKNNHMDDETRSCERLRTPYPEAYRTHLICTLKFEQGWWFGPRPLRWVRVHSHSLREAPESQSKHGARREICGGYYQALSYLHQRRKGHQVYKSCLRY